MFIIDSLSCLPIIKPEDRKAIEFALGRTKQVERQFDYAKHETIIASIIDNPNQILADLLASKMLYGDPLYYKSIPTLAQAKVFNDAYGGVFKWIR